MKIKFFDVKIVMSWIVLGGLVFSLPILFQDEFRVINTDTQMHLNAFQRMQVTGFEDLYLGQNLTGYILDKVSSIIGWEISDVFMWFNFFGLWLSGVVISVVIWLISKNVTGAIASGFVMIFNGATLHLFFSGTIFNLINICMLFPIIMYMGYIGVKNKSIVIGIATVAVFVFAFYFHPSMGMGLFSIDRNYPVGLRETAFNIVIVMYVFFGIVNVVIFGLGLSRIKEYVKNDKAILMVFGVLGVLIAGMLGLAYTGISQFESRLVMNACLLGIITECIVIGYVVNWKELKHKQYYIMVALVVLSVVPNIVSYVTK